MKASHRRGQASSRGEMSALRYSRHKSEAVRWSGGLPRLQPRREEKDLMTSSKNYKVTGATNVSLFRGEGIPDSYAVVFTANTLFFNFPSRCLQPGLSVSSGRNLRGRWHQTKRMISSSNQITTPRREGSHGMSMEVSLCLGFGGKPQEKKASLKMMTTWLSPFFPHRNFPVLPKNHTKKSCKLQLGRWRSTLPTLYPPIQKLERKVRFFYEINWRLNLGDFRSWDMIKTSMVHV